MKKTRLTALFACLLGVSLLTGACSDSEESKEEKSAENIATTESLNLELESLFGTEVDQISFIKSVIDKKAPEFSLPNIEGEKVKLSGFEGKPFIIEFASTTCSACIVTQPAVDQFIANNPSIPLVQIFNGGEDKKDVIAFMDKLNSPKHDNLLIGNRNEKLYNDYQVKYTPTFFFVDHNGYIRLAMFGDQTVQTMQAYADLAFTKVPEELIQPKVKQ